MATPRLCEEGGGGEMTSDARARACDRGNKLLEVRHGGPAAEGVER